MQKTFLLMILFLLGSAVSGQRALKELRNEFSRLVVIQGDSVWLGSQDYIKPQERDSDLVFSPAVRQKWIDSFLIDQYEISNKDYRAFTNWVKDSIIRCLVAGVDSRFWQDSLRHMPRWDLEVDWEIEAVFDTIMNYLYYDGWQLFYNRMEVIADSLKYAFIDAAGQLSRLQIYPDTTTWLREYGSLIEYMTDGYNWHPVYDDYPVVGITREQAEAYCHWRTRQLNALLVKAGMESGSLGFYRLPSADEWEYAAQPKGFERHTRGAILTEHYFTLMSSRNCANLGNIHDDNMLLVHSSVFDTGWSPCLVASGHESARGAYNMPGNVWEWVTDFDTDSMSGIHVFWRQDRYPFPRLPSVAARSGESAEEIYSRLCMLDSRIDSLCRKHPEYKKGLMEGINTVVDDKRVVDKYRGGECAKGGSWNTSVAAALPWTRRLYQRGKSDATTGFRIVLDTGDKGLKEVTERKLMKPVRD